MDKDFNGNEEAFLNDAQRHANRLSSIAPVNANLHKLNFNYTKLQGDVSNNKDGIIDSIVGSNCGQNSSLPDGLIKRCSFANAYVVLHNNYFQNEKFIQDCALPSGWYWIFASQGPELYQEGIKTYFSSFLHEGGHALFGLSDEYDSQDHENKYDIICRTIYPRTEETNI